jgi:hypothetical protein
VRSETENNEGELTNLIANRYQVERLLGRGGMANVYLVIDTSTGRRLALKQLSVKDSTDKSTRVKKLFRREYHTLSHLSHPRVIAVYDYGVDPAGEYYTMELLDGGDVRELLPVGWRRACALLMDICSALSLLHSRRMVHRDLSPRNIRCTGDGLAKLIDFGAMIPMGPSKLVVGTPPYVAPEVLNLQTLDGRADLFSLGATFYYILTGQLAYPAKDFRMLRERWRTPPGPPSDIVPNIPKALDRLVMSLIQLDPALRPANAAEVMERLSAIADLKLDEQLLVSQAYLSTPTLVGRENALMRLRNRLIKARRGKGGSLLIEGRSGIGRTRFIDACILEGKLIGATVLHAGANHQQLSEYRVVRAWLDQLLEIAPDETIAAATPRMEVLGHLFPNLLEKVEAVELQPFEQPHELRPGLHAELSGWLFDICKNRTLMLTVDDFHRIDEPSAAFIAFLARQAAHHSILITASIEKNAPATSEVALDLFANTSAKIELKKLLPEQSEKLLASVFGEVPHIRLLAHRLHQISDGSPRDLMQLAQHLVDKKRVHYQSGSWTLPDRIDEGDLPASIAQALVETLERLDRPTYELAATMALSPGQSFSFDECLILTEHGEPAKLISSLNELVAASVLSFDKERYSISQEGWHSALRRDADERENRAAHLRLVEMFRARGNENFRVAQHLLRAGEAERGLDLLIDYSEHIREVTAKNPEVFTQLILALPKEWLETYTNAIDLCKKLGRPRQQLYSLIRHFSGVAWSLGEGYTIYLDELYQQLDRESGLAFYHQLDASTDAQSRLTRALELVQKQYDESTETERVLAPINAIRELARLNVRTTGYLVEACDLELWRKLPSLQPLVPLSPALWIAEKLVHAFGNRIMGRIEVACREYREILARSEQPDRGGLDETYHKYMCYMIMRGIGMLEAAIGLKTPLELAEIMEKDPSYELHAMQMRMFYYLWQGDSDQTNQCRQNIELLRIQKSPTRAFEGSYLARELPAYALSDDLTGVKRVLNGIKRMAARFPAWVPTLRLARGEYQRIRGDFHSALAEFDEALKIAAPAEHQNWADIVGAKLRTLFELQRYDEMRTLGRESLAIGEREELGYLCNYIQMPLALAEAKLGDEQSGVERADSIVQSLEQIEATGINLGLAYETRARVAIYSNDTEGCTKSISLCREQYVDRINPALVAKYDKLVQEAKNSEAGAFSRVVLKSNLFEQSGNSIEETMSTILTSCDGYKEGAQRLLELFVEYSATASGYLYTLQSDGPLLVAQSGKERPVDGLLSFVKEFLSTELSQEDDNTATDTRSTTGGNSTGIWAKHGLSGYRPVLIGHHTQSGYVVTGLVVLIMRKNRKFIYPIDLIGPASKFLLESGNVASQIAEY